MAQAAHDRVVEASSCTEELVSACRGYVDGVDGLLEALERDVYQAADRCWRLQDRQVQLRGGVLRSKAVIVQEAIFQPDVEQQELAGSLEQWRGAVQSSAAAAALQLRVAEQRLVAAVGRVLSAEPAPSAEQLLGLLHALLGAHQGVALLRKRDLRDALGLLCDLVIQVAAAWRAAGGTDAAHLLAQHEDAPQQAVAALTAPAAADGDQAARLAALQARQAEAAEALSDAADVLRFWGRRGEKAAAGDAGDGREGDVPPMLAEAQAALSAASQAYEEEQAAGDLRTRQLVCQRYRPRDAAVLQADADSYADGERLPAQPSLTFESEFVQERGWARARAIRLLNDGATAAAAAKLHQLQHLLLEAALPPESAVAWQQLLVRVAEALLNGGTPPAAVPLLAALLERGLGRRGAEELTSVSERDKARLVPMICRGMAPQPSGRVLLRQHEGVGLLQSLLKPEGMLNGGRLRQFHDTLEVVVDSCSAAHLPSDTTQALLSPFDATRFAVLACEQLGAGGGHDEDEGDGGAGGSSGGGGGGAQGGRVGMQQLLALAHASLAQPGADGVGLALLEGVLTLQPASYLGAALQLGLACRAESARHSVLAMLCRVPLELLPPPVVADALAQVSEAVDSNQLAPPFLPYELVGRLYRSPHVLRSLQLAVERGPGAAAAEAAAAAPSGGQQLWTARVGRGGGEDGTHGGEAAQGASGSSGAQGQGGASQAGGQGGGGGSLVLLPVQPVGEPLAALLQQLVGALLSGLLRRAGSALDAASLSEELLQLLEVLLMPAAEQGAWLLEWLWRHLYQEALRPFLADASAALDGSGGGGPLQAAFLSYWASLPWRQATFHAASPAALTAVRLHLVASSPDGAAAALLRELDFAPVLAKAAPVQRPERVQQVYSLVDDEDEEAEPAAGDLHGRGAWAAELGLLALHACVVLPPQEHPEWLHQLLHGAPQQAQRQPGFGEEEGDVHALMRSPLSAALLPLVSAAGALQPLLPHLLAAADWDRLALGMLAEQDAGGAAAPWLLLPALLAPASIGGDVGGRLVHAASLLGRAALLAGSPQAAECAAGAASPLLLCTLCQGMKHRPDQQPRRARLAAADPGVAPPVQAGQEEVVVPEGFPLELLADTVEGQQLMLLQQQERERGELQQLAGLQLEGSSGGAQQQGEPAAAQAGAGEQQSAEAQGEQAPRQALPLVEVAACWSLTADQHSQLLQQALLPLAASQASLDLAAALQPEQCPAELRAAQQGDGGALVEWRQPTLVDLLQAAGSAATAAAAGAGGTGGASGRGGVAGIAALLLPLARRPLTILTQEALPWANTELPLDTEAALYVSVAADAAGASASHAPPAPRRTLPQSLAALLPGARRRAQHAGLEPGPMDAHVLRAQLRLAVQAACKTGEGLPLAACLLRLLCACPALHTCAEAQQLGEGLLRFLAAPERDGGPLGQGAAASALLSVASAADAGTAVELSRHSAAEDVVPLETAGGAADAAAEGTPRGGGAPAGGALHVAVTAAQGLPPASLLGLAHGAAELHAPLTAALAVERLRQGTTVLPKEEWQGLATQVLQVAVRADAEPAHPFDLVAPWLAALHWVADSRWRRLPSGPHQAALLEWVEALELRVVALRLAHPDDFWLDGGSPGGGSPNRLLTGAADRFRAIRQRMTGDAPPAGGPHPADDGASTHTAVASEGGEEQLGQRISKGFRSLLGGKGGVREAPSGGPGESSAPAGQGGPPGKKGWGEKVRHRLARIGRGNEEEEEGGAGPEAVGTTVPAVITPALSGGLGRAAAPSGLGTVAEEAASLLGSEAGGDVGHLDPAVNPGSGGGGGAGTGQLVKQRLSSGLHAVGRGISKVKTRLADRQGGTAAGAPDEVADRDQDVAVRVGLAAFAVSAYIKSVLCPSLASRLGSDSTGPATPTLGVVRGHHRQTSSFGSMRLDAEYMREMDRVLEARSELDTLEVLAACPLLQLRPDRYRAFLADAPALLSAATGVETFNRCLQQLLFEPERQLLSWM